MAVVLFSGTSANVCSIDTIAAALNVLKPEVKLLPVWQTSFLYAVSKENASTLTNYSFDKHGLILIIFSRQHQHTFKNDVRIPLSLYRYFYLLYLLLNNCDGNDAKQRVFFGRLLMALKRAGYAGLLALKTANFRNFSDECYQLATVAVCLIAVQSDVLLPSCLRVTALSVDQLLCRWRF